MMMNDEEIRSVTMPRFEQRKTHGLTFDSTPGLRGEEPPSN